MPGRAHMERTEHRTLIQSQTNSHTHRIYPSVRLLDLDTSSKPTEEDQCNGIEKLPLPLSYIIQISHHQWDSVQ